MLFGFGFFFFFGCLVVWFGLVGFFPKIIFPSRAHVKNTEYCFIYEKVDDNDGYIMGKSNDALAGG